MSNADKVFAGSIPKIYDKYLVPLIFEPYAQDLVKRVRFKNESRILELAAGTGVVTRALANASDGNTAIVATDLNQAMLDQAAAVGTVRSVEWRQADATALPFADRSFDTVLCQFGVMFFADKAKAFSEVRRVLRPGGRFIFNVWDRIAENEFSDIVNDTLSALFPVDPPKFLARTPYGYHDRSTIEHDLRSGGFQEPAQVETVAMRSRAQSAWEPSIAFCQGTPLCNEIESRAPTRLTEVTSTVGEAIARRFGPGPVDGKIQAHVVSLDI